jgi:hypothetical protein
MRVGVYGTEAHKMALQNKTSFPLEIIDMATDWSVFDLVFFDIENHAAIDVAKLASASGLLVTELVPQLPNAALYNGWPTMIERPILEVANCTNEHLAALDAIGIKHIHIAKTTTMPSANVVAMIVNEAYYALEETVSTKKEIDTAMKLGTNYPYGPFEWSEKIGLNRIASLLAKLTLHDERYLPSTLLLTEANSL